MIAPPMARIQFTMSMTGVMSPTRSEYLPTGAGLLAIVVSRPKTNGSAGNRGSAECQPGLVVPVGSVFGFVAADRERGVCSTPVALAALDLEVGALAVVARGDFDLLAVFRPAVFGAAVFGAAALGTAGFAAADFVAADFVAAGLDAAALAAAVLAAAVLAAAVLA